MLMMGMEEIAGGGIDLVVSSFVDFAEVLKKSLYLIDDQTSKRPFQPIISNHLAQVKAGQWGNR